MANRTKVLILSLILVIVVLTGILTYAFAVQPAIINKQNMIYTAGYNTAQVEFLNGMVNQLQQTGYVQIPVGENQTLVLVPYQQSQTPQVPAQ